MAFNNSLLSGGRAGCNEILPRLYLGDITVATKKEEISRLGITDMITVEINPLEATALASCVKRYLYINVMDHSKQDIMSHFDTSNEFIETALRDPTNKVFVHCVAGISRSASLVLAYIMKTRSMSYTEAYDLVSQKRRCIDPNEGFVRQLVLYHKMKYTIDIANQDYRRMVLDALVFEFRLLALSEHHLRFSRTTDSGTLMATASSSSMGGTPSAINIINMSTNLTNKRNIKIIFDQYYNKLHLQQVSKYPEVYDSQTAFRCNKCRTIVFYAISVIENKLGSRSVSAGSSTGQVALKSPGAQGPVGSDPGQKGAGKECPFVFVEPQPWMKIMQREGNLECWKCLRKLGKFDWNSGESCSCALHHSHRDVNLFKIMRKKIDPGTPRS